MPKAISFTFSETGTSVVVRNLQMSDSVTSFQENNAETAFNVNEHFVRLLYSDGFSWRLLHVSLFVKFNFEYVLSFQTFESQPLLETGVLPSEICEKLTGLLELDFETLKEEYYIHQGATDYSCYSLRVNNLDTCFDYYFGLPFYTHEYYSNGENELIRTLELVDKWLVGRIQHEINFKMNVD